MYAYIDKSGNLKKPPSVLRDVQLTFPPPEEGGEPITGLYNVGYDPNVEPEPEVVAYLLDHGYLPVAEAERPEDGDGYHYEADYIEGDGEIVQVWERVENEPEPLTIEDGVRYLTGGM